VNGTVLSSNESHFNNVRYENGFKDPTGKSSEANLYTNTDKHQSQILNYSSDQNLHDRRPFTTGNENYGIAKDAVEGLKNATKFGRGN